MKNDKSIIERISMEKQKQLKRINWDFALGVQKIDDYTPSKEFLELVEKEVNGEITTDDIIKILDKKYKK